MANDDGGGDDGPPKETPAPKKVGPGNPPVEYRWEKGCPSPNPNGRPRKKKSQGLLAQMDPIAARILKHNDRVITQMEGEDVTNFDAVMRGLSKQAVKSPKAAEIYFKVLDAANKKDFDIRKEIFTRAVDHKEQFSEKFAQRERMGLSPLKIYPHPDDIILEDGMKVRFVGPVNAEGAWALREVMKIQDALIESGNLLATAEGRPVNEAFSRKLWTIVRAKFYRLNPLVPPRLRKKFPRFEPSSPPEE